MRVGRGSRGIAAWASASLSGAASLGLWAGFQDNNRDPAELVHGAVVLVLGGVFLYYAIRLMNPPSEAFAMQVFGYSIWYLMALFAFLLVDHWLLPPATAPAVQFMPIS